MTAFALNRRGFLGGLIATLGAAAVAPVLKPALALAGPLPPMPPPNPFLKAMEFAQADMESVTGLVEATQGMVEDAIAEAREFNLRELMWTARFNVFQHNFEVVGKTREQGLLDAMSQMLGRGIDYRVMPEQVCEHLNKSYCRLWDDSQYDIDQVELALSPAQMGMIGASASMVPRAGFQGVADIDAGERVQRVLDGSDKPVRGSLYRLKKRGGETTDGSGTSIRSSWRSPPHRKRPGAQQSRNYIRTLAGQPTRSWKQGETES